jgi:hypothetical protein
VLHKGECWKRQPPPSCLLFPWERLGGEEDMVERRYGFRFSGFEGLMLLLGVLGSSFFIFVSGVYIGREVAERRYAPQAQMVRIPVPPSTELPAVQKIVKNESLEWPTGKEPVLPTSLVGKPEIPPSKAPQTEEVKTVANLPVVQRELSLAERDPAPSEKPEQRLVAKKEPALTNRRSPTEGQAFANRSRAKTSEEKPVPVSVVRLERMSESATKKRPPVPETGNTKHDKNRVVHPEFYVVTKQE